MSSNQLQDMYQFKNHLKSKVSQVVDSTLFVKCFKPFHGYLQIIRLIQDPSFKALYK